MRLLLLLGLFASVAVGFAVLGDVRTSEVAMTLALVVGAIATGAVAVASYRERIVISRLVRRLRDPSTRARTIDELRQRVAEALQSGSEFRREEALRFALEPLIVAGLWDEVASLTQRAGLTKQGPTHGAFWRWLAGVRALAELHRGELEAAEEVLTGMQLDDPWLRAVDALRLALAGEGDEAMTRIEEIDGASRLGLAVRYQRDLAEIHALAALGKRAEARSRLESSIRKKDGMAQAVLDLEGPASPIARGVIASDDGPFRAAG